MKYCYLMVKLLLVLSSYFSVAQNSTSPSPYFLLSDPASKVEQFPLLHTEAEVQIAGMIADVKVQQVYHNSGEKPIEAVYVFPASTNAAIYAMKMQIGDRQLIATIQEKQKARQNYEKAKNQGKNASLLEQHRPNVFQMNVANIMPGDTIQVVLQYTEVLNAEEGTYEFVYPTVVGPRYSGELPTSKNQSHQWVENPYLEEGKKSPYTFDFKLSLQSDIPVEKITSPSHQIAVNYPAKKKVAVQLDPSDKWGGNKDLIIRYQLQGKGIESGLLAFEKEEENFFLLMMEPPARPQASDIPGREYIFVVDVSGSMNGYPLEVSKELLRDLIGHLQPTDLFNVLTFAGRSGFLSERSLPATSENINKAINAISTLQGSGGTNMLGAIKKVLATPKTEGFSRSFVIATDGYISVEPSIFSYIQGHLGDANFFAFGIGSSINRHLIEGIAYVGQSKPFITTNATDARQAADRFRKYIQTPVLTDIKLSFNGLNVYDVSPLQQPDLLAERPLIVYGKYKGEWSGEIEIKGVTGKKKFKRFLKTDASQCSEDNLALQYLWARHQIKMLSDYTSQSGNPEINIPKQVTELGLQYNLLTKYTSFVAIDTIIRNTEGEINSVKQPLPLPEGVSNLAIGEKAKGQKQDQSTMGLRLNGTPLSPPPPTIEEVPVHGTIGFHDQSIEEGTAIRAPQPNYSAPPPPPPPPAMEMEEIFKVVEEMPRFPGCEELEASTAEKKECANQKMMNFVYTNLYYPPLARENGVEGMVVIQFVVDENGKMTDLKVIRDIGAGCGEEALRLVKEMAKKIQWIPGKRRGRPVKVQYNLPIRFRLS